MKKEKQVEQANMVLDQLVQNTFDEQESKKSLNHSMQKKSQSESQLPSMD